MTHPPVISSLTLVPSTRPVASPTRTESTAPILSMLHPPTMTPRTRSSNRDADCKVYYSKKVPQQIQFPHKRKIVRRRCTPVEHGKRQMVFLPEKMKRQSTPVIADSDEDRDADLEEDLEDGRVPIGLQGDEGKEQPSTRKEKGESKKRSSHVKQDGSHGDEEPVEPVSKRRRTAVSPKDHRRPRRVEAASDAKSDATAIKANRERTLRRQSTMTQLADGRKPLPGSEEPGFQPIKQNPRLSWSGRSKSEKAINDKKQRTLTQIIPDMRTQEIMSDEDTDEASSDVEADERASQTYGDTVAQRLAQQGLYRVEGNAVKNHEAADEYVEVTQQNLETEHVKKEPTAESQATPDLVVQSVEDEMKEDREDSYKPTQFIEAPVTRTTRASRHGNGPQATETGEALYQPQRQARTGKARFSLLSTPEKRRIREIPSSQSPADSPLSTQISPQKLRRSPLKMCSGNLINAPETPSRRKQVTFKMPSKTPIPPPTLRKFESTIQDSEDEDCDDILEEDLPASRRLEGVNAQTFPSRFEFASGKVVGADTQAMLDRIDQACADANGEYAMSESGSSQESDDSSTLRGHNEPSPELDYDPYKFSNGRRSSHSTESNTVKQEPECDDDDDGDEDATILPTAPLKLSHEKGLIVSDATTITEGELPLPAEQLRSTPPIIESYNQYTRPSTPMVINDDSSDEGDSPAPDPTPPRSTRRQAPQLPSTLIPQSADLDGDTIQVPRSPSPDHETQHSHSSKAEQQLQNEWFSYSQYIHARPPQSSSMRAAPDAFSYNATPRAPQTTAPYSKQTQQPSAYHHPSQATTIDEITQHTTTTPRNKRTHHHLSSTHTTPHRIASSQPVFSSPSKPPPLFIPSSFPSPEKAAMEGWGSSSPVLGGMTQATGARGWKSSQWASLEDFSIPLPPPPVDGED